MLKYFSTVHSQPDLTEHQTWLQHPYQKEKRYFCITVLKEFQLYNRHSAVIKSRCNHQYCLVVFTSFFFSLYFPSSYFPYGACSNSGTNSVCTHASPQGSCQEPCPAQCSITLRQPSPPSPPPPPKLNCFGVMLYQLVNKPAPLGIKTLEPRPCSLQPNTGQARCRFCSSWRPIRTLAVCGSRVGQ